jgi:4-hydroxybenzoate polyprenyltransferase
VRSKFAPLVLLLKSSHPVPSMAVSVFTVLFAIGLHLELQRILLVGFAVLAQQFSVGLSNDWLDYARDKAVGRADKPVATEKVNLALVRASSFAFAIIALAFAGLLDVQAFLLMFPMLAVGWAYNLGLKANWSSVLPYAIGFGMLPLFVTLSAAEPRAPAPWIIAVAALLGVSAHFANALPDLIEDKATGVRALPHVIGQRWSSLVISISTAVASVTIALLGRNLPVGIAVVGVTLAVGLALYASILALRPVPPRKVFTLLLIATLANVILLMLGI